VKLSFIIPSRPGTDLSGIRAELARLDLAGAAGEFFFVEGTLPPLQRNVAIRQSTGDFVFLLDDDLLVPPDLVPRTLVHFDDDRVAGVGGPNLTPEHDPPLAQLSGELLASPLATGRTSCRWREGPADLDATESQLHGCFLCFRGDLLRRYLFVEDLFPNDENELMARLRQDGYRLRYVPECSVQHKRRSTVRSHLKQVFISGRGRGELVRRCGVRGQMFYLAPLAFIVYLLAVALVAAWLPVLWAPLAAYAGMAAALSLGTWARRRRPIFLWAGPLMFASHVAYGIGLAKGLAAQASHHGGAVKVEIVESGSWSGPGSEAASAPSGQEVGSIGVGAG
jgi:hypothetical protein